MLFDTASGDPPDQEPSKRDMEWNQTVVWGTTKAVHSTQPAAHAWDPPLCWFRTCNFSLCSLALTTHFQSVLDLVTVLVELVFCAVFSLCSTEQTCELMHCLLARSSDQNQIIFELMAPDAAPVFRCISESSYYLDESQWPNLVRNATPDHVFQDVWWRLVNRTNALGLPHLWCFSPQSYFTTSHQIYIISSLKSMSFP